MSKRQTTTQKTLPNTSGVPFTSELSDATKPHKQFLEELPPSTRPGGDRYTRLWQVFIDRHGLEADDLHISDAERRRIQRAPK